MKFQSPLVFLEQLLVPEPSFNVRNLFSLDKDEVSIKGRGSLREEKICRRGTDENKRLGSIVKRNPKPRTARQMLYGHLNSDIPVPLEPYGTVKYKAAR